ncbi:MAG TPA: HAD-IIA family hydrolase [Anaerolineae bacterium]|nr:HAD-IIA family hydrolase [Anaerolineae bacterium]
MKFLSTIQGFLLDMDGTFYLGDRLLPGAKKLLELLEHKNVRYLFLTNNSSKHACLYAQKFQSLGVNVPEENIFTSGQATAIFLKEREAGSKVYVVGTQALIDEFVQSGFVIEEQNPDFVVLGFDTALTYEKLWKLCNFVRSGLPYYATHPDFNCPTEKGFMPDIGAMIAFVAASTGRKPDVIIGKPNRPMVDIITAKLSIPVNKLAMVGDRLYTDIALGKAGIKTILVLSGETKLEDLEGSEFQPDLIVEDLAELVEIMGSCN